MDSYVSMCISILVIYVCSCCNGRDIRCRTVWSNKELIVSGFNSIQGFRKISCRPKGVRRVEYTQCTVDFIKLDMKRLHKLYPYMKELIWGCKGVCVYEAYKLKFKISGNCHEGNFVILFIGSTEHIYEDFDNIKQRDIQ